MARTSNRKSVERGTAGTSTTGRKGRGKAPQNDLGAIAEADNLEQNATDSNAQLAQEMAQSAQAAMPEEDPSREVVMDNLPMTYSTAMSILEELGRAASHAASMERALTINTPLDTKLRYTGPALSQEVLRLLAVNNDGYLDTAFLKRAIFGNENGGHPFPAALVNAIGHSINLALLASHLFTWITDQADLYSTINMLDQRFPVQFLNGFIPAYPDSKLIQDTWEIAVGIRTQAAIASYREGDIGNPADSFYMEDLNGEPIIRGFAGGISWADQEDELQRRAAKLQNIMGANGDNHMAAVPSLQEAFDLHQFVINALLWIRSRTVEVKNVIKSAGGIENAFYTVLENQMPSGNFNAPQVGAQKELFTQSGGFPGSSIQASQISQDAGFLNHIGPPTPTPSTRKTGGKRKGNDASNPPKETKKQKVQRENYLDPTELKNEVETRAQLMTDQPFQPTPTQVVVPPPKEKAQSRVKWTALEVAALVYYIEKLGPAWSKIKDVDDKDGIQYLGQRDQVALKDKARNLKFEALKTGRPMYRNFESVTLSQSMRDKLANANTPQLPSGAPMDVTQHGAAVEGDPDTILPGVREFAAATATAVDQGQVPVDPTADDDMAGSQNGEPAFEDAPEMPTQDNVPVDPDLVR